MKCYHPKDDKEQLVIDDIRSKRCVLFGVWDKDKVDITFVHGKAIFLDDESLDELVEHLQYMQKIRKR